jgi:cytochrome P450
MPSFPVSSLDPFADDFLAAPYPFYAELRDAGNRALSAKPMAGLRAGFKEAAEKLADELVARRQVDAIVDIAEAYPLNVFPEAVGLGRQGVENLLPYGAMVFNAFGPRNAHFEAAMAEAAKVVPWINAQCAREALSPAGLRNHLGCGRHRRDHGGGGATVGALAALGRTRHHYCRHR